MFNGKAISLLLVALVFGAGAAVFANNWLQQQVSTTVVNEQSETLPVVVAQRDIPFGQVIEDIHIKIVQWPADVLPQGVVPNAEMAIGFIANQKILEGEPILEARVVEKLTGSKLSALIAPNKRAVSVRVNDVAGVAGFLLPGNHVDVLGSKKTKSGIVTSIVLQNIKVLAVDQKASQEKDDPLVVRAVTLEADVDQSLKLVKATREG